MARLPRLRESFNTAEVWDKAHFLNQEELQPYAEAVAKINRNRLKESEDTEKYNKKLEEAVKILSSILDEDSKAHLSEAVKRVRENESKYDDYKVWTVPISRFGNLCANKRRYSDKLWENVINNQKHLWKGIPGLCDHPKDPDDAGELKYACIVWLDLAIDYANKLIWGTGIFVGPLGRLLQEIIEVGGRVGFSSSGFGEKIPGTDDVNPDTYEIERVADVVINPSQSVYGDLNPENDCLDKVTQAKTVEFTKQQPILKEGANMKLKEETQQPAVNQQAAVNSQSAGNTTQNTEQNNAQTQPAENNIQNTAQTQPAENTAPAAQPAQTTETQNTQPAAQPAQNTNVNAQQAASAIVQAVNAVDGGQKMQENNINKSMRKKYIESYLKNDLVGMPLKEKIESLKSMKEQLSEFSDEENMKKIQEALDNAVAEENELLAEAEKLKTEHGVEKLAETTEIINTLEESVQTLANDKKESDKLTEAFLERNKALKEQLSKENLKAEFKINIANKKKQLAEKKLAESRAINKDLMKRHNSFIKRLNEAESSEIAKKDEIIRKLTEANKTLERKLNYTLGLNQKFQEENQRLQISENQKINQIGRLQNYNNKLLAERDNAQKALAAFKEEVEYVRNPNKHLAEGKADRIANSLNLREDGGRAVDTYYNDLLKRYGESIKPFEKEILGCKTYTEATRVFLNNKEKIDNNFREAKEAWVSPNITNQKKRSEYLREAGMPIADNADTEWATKVFSERMSKFGLGGTSR